MPGYFNIFNGTQMNSLRGSNIQRPQGILHQIPLPALPVLQRSSQRATGCWTPQKATSPSGPAPLRRNPGTRAGQAYSPCPWTVHELLRKTRYKKAFLRSDISSHDKGISRQSACAALWHGIPSHLVGDNVDAILLQLVAGFGHQVDHFGGDQDTHPGDAARRGELLRKMTHLIWGPNNMNLERK